jgi:hypothetical protein
VKTPGKSERHFIVGRGKAPFCKKVILGKNRIETARTAQTTFLQRFLYCCLRIRCRGDDVFTEPLLSNGGLL